MHKSGLLKVSWSNLKVYTISNNWQELLYYCNKKYASVLNCDTERFLPSKFSASVSDGPLSFVQVETVGS